MKHFVFVCSISFKPLLLLCILGASSDFDGATKIAKMMVTRFGMSDKVKFEFFYFFLLYTLLQGLFFLQFIQQSAQNQV